MSGWVRGLRTHSPNKFSKEGRGRAPIFNGWYQSVLETSNNNSIPMKKFSILLPSQVFRQLTLKKKKEPLFFQTVTTQFCFFLAHSHLYSSLSSVDYGKTDPKQLLGCSMRIPQTWSLLFLWTQLEVAYGSLEAGE